MSCRRTQAQTFVALAGTVGYRLNEQWSIGGGPIVLYTDSTSKARVNNLVGPDGKIELEEDGFGLGWQLGLMYEFSESARIGAVYRAEIDPDLTSAVRARQQEYMSKSNSVTSEFVESWSLTRRLWNNTLAMLGPVL